MKSYIKQVGTNGIGIKFCHRLPDRTFTILGKKFVLCSRCTGLYTGLLTMPLFYFNAILFPLFSFLLILPLVIDGVSQFFGLRKSNNILRFVTGILFTVGLINLVLWL